MTLKLILFSLTLFFCSISVSAQFGCRLKRKDRSLAVLKIKGRKELTFENTTVFIRKNEENWANHDSLVFDSIVDGKIFITKEMVKIISCSPFVTKKLYDTYTFDIKVKIAGIQPITIEDFMLVRGKVIRKRIKI